MVAAKLGCKRKVMFLGGSFLTRKAFGEQCDVTKSAL